MAFFFWRLGPFASSLENADEQFVIAAAISAAELRAGRYHPRGSAQAAAFPFLLALIDEARGFRGEELPEKQPRWISDSLRRGQACRPNSVARRGGPFFGGVLAAQMEQTVHCFVEYCPSWHVLAWHIGSRPAR